MQALLGNAWDDTHTRTHAAVIKVYKVTTKTQNDHMHRFPELMSTKIKFKPCCRETFLAVFLLSAFYWRVFSGTKGSAFIFYSFFILSSSSSSSLPVVLPSSCFIKWPEISKTSLTIRESRALWDTSWLNESLIRQKVSGRSRSSFTFQDGSH